MRRILPEHVLLIATCLCMAVVASLLMAVSASGAPPRLKTFRGKVVKVIDGDTAWIETRLVTRTVRLAEIDAPERKQPWGTEAREALEKQILNKDVVVTWREKDGRYGRYVGHIELPQGDDKSLKVNAWLVEQGHAWKYLAYSKSEELAKLEAEAREKKKGLWKNDSPIPPWEWRHGKREP